MDKGRTHVQAVFWWITFLFRNLTKRSGPLKTNAAVPEKQTIIFFGPYLNIPAMLVVTYVGFHAIRLKM